MEKKIQDYLHYFMGCEMLWEFTDGSGGGRDTMTEYHLNEARIGSIKIKPLLFPISALTMEDANYLADCYSEWAWRKDFSVKSLDHTDKSAFITIYYVLEGAPHGIGDGEYTEQLIITAETIWGRDSVERSDHKIVLNTHRMTHYLLSRGYDLYSLIPSGLAIDKTLQSHP